MDYLLTEMENNIGSLVVVFAGYQKKIDKLLEHNEGLPSRFPFKFVFEDYTDSELMLIMEKTMIKKFDNKPFVVHGGVKGKSVRILIRRIAQMRGSTGFGNARAVQNALERVLENQAKRISEERRLGNIPDDYEIKREDLLGPDPTTALSKSGAWKELQDMIGLDSVKKCVESMIEVVKTNVEKEKNEQPLLKLTLNRLFLG